jgi:arylformamidase
VYGKNLINEVQMAKKSKTKKKSKTSGGKTGTTKAAKSPWIDITVPVREGMHHWPGDRIYKREVKLNMEKGDRCNLSFLSMGAHTGTHMDAPLHFVNRGKPMEKMPIDAVVGPARVIAIKDRESIKADELRGHRIRKGQRILFKTINSSSAWKKKKFFGDFVHIRCDAAEYLAERGVQTVGVDYLSVGGYERDGEETHQALLGAGMWLIEGLDLSKVKPGRVQLICLPLKLMGSEGAPARAIVRQLG